MNLCACGCGRETGGKWAPGHNMRPDRPKWIEDPDTGCWNWQWSTRNGYGQIALSSARSPAPAHRWVYETHRGPIPEGLELDHLCRNRACVNPDHLEPVTSRENLRRGNGFSGRNARKTHCDVGHPLSGDNLYVDPKGRRQCRACRREQTRAFHERNPEYNAEYLRAWRVKQREVSVAPRGQSS